MSDIFYRMVSNTERVSTPFEEMSPPELNKCLQKFYLSARKRDGSFCNKKSLTTIRAALDGLGSSLEKSSIFQAIFYYWRQSIYNKANTSLNNFLKTLSKSGQIAPTVHKQPLRTKKVVTKKVSLLTLTHSNHTNCSKQPGFLSVCSLENEVVKTSSF